MATPDRDRVSPQWTKWRESIDLDEYHVRWERMEASGTASHGEADLVESFEPTSVLDAGCGMGRVAIELHRRGVDVVGVDLDDELLRYAQQDAPHLHWRHADLATVDLGRTFDVAVMAGNVMVFCRVDDRRLIVDRLAAHLVTEGVLVAGFSLNTTDDALTLAEYDEYCEAAGLQLMDRFSTWERAPYDGGDYAVSVHLRR